jgi:hypothetical protein
MSILAVVGMATTAAGGIMGAIGAEMKGGAASAQARYQQGLATLNAKIMRQNEDYARFSGETEAQQKDMRNRQIIAQTRAAQGASNIDVGGMSQTAVRAGEFQVAAEDAAIIRSNAAKRAYGFEVEAQEAELQSTMYDYAAQQAGKGADIEAITSILGGASKVAGMGMDYYSKFGSSSSSSAADKWVQAGQGEGPWAAS